jgi:hypothetical protein
MTNLRPLARTRTHVRCGTPDCDWGIPFAGFELLGLHREQFREHCIQRHGLDPSDRNRVCWFDLVAFTLTLIEEKACPTVDFDRQRWVRDTKY